MLFKIDQLNKDGKKNCLGHKLGKGTFTYDVRFSGR